MRSVLSLFALLLLSACAAAPKPYESAQAAASGPLRLMVGSVLVDDTSKPTGQPPFVDHLLLPTPAQALREAVRARYLSVRPSVYGAARLRFIISEASIVENQITAPEAKNWFERQTRKGPEYSYTGRMSVTAQTEGTGVQKAFVQAEANRSLEVGGLNEDARMKQVEGLRAQMIDDLLAELDKGIRANLGQYVVSGPDITITPEPSGRWDKVKNWQ